MKIISISNISNMKSEIIKATKILINHAAAAYTHLTL
jgi:hypothetical protein